MLDRYMDRPDQLFCNGHLCCAECALHIKENDWQPVEFSDEILENNFPDQVYLPVIPLMSSKNKLKCRKVPSVLRFFILNKNKNFELYAHHVLMLYLPFRRESELV